MLEARYSGLILALIDMTGRLLCRLTGDVVKVRGEMCMTVYPRNLTKFVRLHGSNITTTTCVVTGLPSTANVQLDALVG